MFLIIAITQYAIFIYKLRDMYKLFKYYINLVDTSSLRICVKLNYSSLLHVTGHLKKEMSPDAILKICRLLLHIHTKLYD